MKNTSPPHLAQKILKWYGGKAELEDIQGDLDEFFYFQLQQHSVLYAKMNYWQQVLSLLFSYALRRRKSRAAYSPYYVKNSITMFKNYFKIAFRNFSKHKLFTSLNIIGLSLGMCICLLALSISVAIYQSDNWQQNKDRVFQINTSIADQESNKTFASTFYATGHQLEENYPFVEQIVNIQSGFQPEIDHHGNMINVNGYFAGASFFDVFSFKLVEGDPKKALAQPFNIVITEKIADKLFHEQNPIGKTIKTDLGTFTVTGVIEDLKQTHFYFEVLASYSTFTKLKPNFNHNDWLNYRNHYVYALLKDGNDATDLAIALNHIETIASEFHDNQEIKLAAIALDEVVPRWNVSNALGIGWDQPSMIFFMVIGLLVLLPAVFNYTNLSIARALKRAKEIGIRKVVGADKKQIKAQFIVETIVLSILALGGSLLILYPLKQEFLSMVVAAEVLDTDPNFAQIITFLLFSITVGLMAGIFPAKYFSRLNPVQTLKGEIKNSRNSVSGFKKGLFVFQFFLSLVFVIGVLAVARQYSFVLNTNHGFQSDNILTVPFEGIDKEIAINELSKHPDVKSISTASSLPGVFLSESIMVTPNNHDTLQVAQVFTAHQLIEKLNIELVYGESSTLNNSNKNEEFVVVNEQFLKSMSVFEVSSDSMRFTLEDGTQCKISGIVKDFNFEPLSETIQPMIFRHSLENSQYALLTVNTTDIKRTINELDAIWHSIDQNILFQATFLDDEIESAYYFISVQIKFFSVLSALAITISCLGLLGMVSFTTENRTKEIAIRKIMGASTQSLYFLLTRDFLKLILIATVIAVPVSYVFYDRLFLYFLIRYGTGLGLLEILGSVLFLFLVGIASIYWQTSKVTRSNPASKLRYE